MQSHRRHKITVLLLAALACAFIAGVYNLLVMRFDAGDVYPYYSSLRPDPLGTMALFESIEAVEGITAERNLKPLNMMHHQDGATVLYLGLSARRLEHMGKDEAKILESLAYEGSRVVIAMHPAPAKEDYECPDSNSDEKKTESPADKDAGKKSPEKNGKQKLGGKSDEDTSPPPFFRTFGFQLGIKNAGDIDTNGSFVSMAQKANNGGDLPSSLQWHSAAYIDQAASLWETIYSVDGKPVAAHRKLGAGSVIFITDAYYLTNEALLSSRQPELLAWLIGPNSNVIFEESHLGISESPGVATLGRKYRLHWFALALLVLAFLFVWQNATSLVPHGQFAADEGNIVSDKDYASGMISLMRRNITPSRLIHSCVEEWRKSFSKISMKHAANADRVDRLLKQSTKVNPVKLYGAIYKILNERKRL